MRTSPKDIGELLGQSLENGVCPDDQLPSERDLAEEFAVSRQGIHAVYPDARHVPAKVRTFIDFMRASVN